MISINEWCQTEGNYNITLHCSTELSKIRPYTLFIGGVHGDEPEGVSLALHLLDYVKKQPTTAHWAIITCLNPYGIAHKQRTNSNKVDLNRNFHSRDWSPDHSKERYYPGKSPESEKETIALSQLISNTPPELVVHFHSWKPSIILTGPKNCKEAELFSKCSNYELMHDIGYPTPGSLGQYCWLNHNIPVVCIEEAENVNPMESWLRFKPAFETILNKKS